MNAITKDLIVPKLLNPRQRQITGGKSLSGGVYFEIEGYPDRVEMSPQEALDFASAIMRMIGIHLEFPAPPSA